MAREWLEWAEERIAHEDQVLDWEVAEGVKGLSP